MLKLANATLIDINNTFSVSLSEVAFSGDKTITSESSSESE